MRHRRRPLLFALVVASTRSDDATRRYVDAWLSPSADRCGSKHCDWMAAFGPIDVACAFDVEAGLSRDGSASPRAPKLAIAFADESQLTASPRDHSSRRFRRRPAVCEHRRSNKPAGPALVMVANGADYLFRLWPLFLHKLAYARAAGLRPFLWVGELPPALGRATKPTCLASAEAGRVARRLGDSFYDGRVDRGDVGLVSNHYIKMPAALAVLADPTVDGLYFVDLDAAAPRPWDPAPLAAPGTDVAFHVEKSFFWRASGSRYYARSTAFAADFFARWFDNRCSFKDQYSLWHTILEVAGEAGCVAYGGELWRDLKYWEAKKLAFAAARGRFPGALDLACGSACPLAAQFDGCNRFDLLGDLVHATIPGNATRLREFRYVDGAGAVAALGVADGAPGLSDAGFLDSLGLT